MKKSVTQTVAAHIKLLRKKHHYNQAQIANLINIEESGYNRLENGKIMVSLEKLYKLAKVYNEPIAGFFKEIVDNAPEIGAEESEKNLSKISEGEEKILEKLNALEQLINELKSK